MSRKLPLLVLLLALIARAGIFRLPHREGDERIYAALLSQVRAGHGYTLRGHPILEQDWMVRDQYDTRLFYHPPGGLVWFAAFTALFGERGWDLAQLAAFAVFFLATYALARDTLPAFPPEAALTVGLLAGATPIVAHVSMHRWLDGPQVAAIALAALISVRAARSGSAGSAIGAGIAIGAAMLIKMSVALALPGMIALAWAASPGRTTRQRVRTVAIAGGVAALCLLPWLIAEARAFGTIFPSWAGKPSARLVAENPFIRQVTVVRSPWVYLRLLPTTVWTLGPSLAILALSRRRGGVPLACALWIAIVTAAGITLGAIGYSKLLRYLVPIGPAAVVLAGFAAGEVVRRRGALGVVLRVVLAAAVLAEVAHGVQTLIVYPDRAWIRPLAG